MRLGRTMGFYIRKGKLRREKKSRPNMQVPIARHWPFRGDFYGGYVAIEQKKTIESRSGESSYSIIAFWRLLAQKRRF